MSIQSISSPTETFALEVSLVSGVLNSIDKFYCRFSNTNSLEDDAAKIFKENSSEMFSVSDRVEIVNHILKSRKGNILRLVEIVKYKFPDYEFSSFQQVLMDIIKDEESCTLNYEAICEKLHDGGCFSLENLDICVDRAFLLRHHGITTPSNDAVKVHDYVINFLWINLDAQDREKNEAQNVFGSGTDQESEADFLGKVEVWANDHPGAKINLWIDTALVTKRAVRQTFGHLKEMSRASGVDLCLCDIRSLDKVRTSMGRYFHPSTPVYFRVDLAKVFIADELMMRPDLFKYVVVSDVDIGSQTVDSLFDRRTISFLDEYGYVFNASGIGHLENSFFIFMTGREALRKTHCEIMINRMDEKMKYVEQSLLDTHFYDEYQFGSQSVFSGYREFTRETEKSSLSLGFSVPRKAIKTPPSQFNFGGNFSGNLADHRNEFFRFIWGGKTPYVKRGRAMYDAYSCYNYVELSKYREWKPEPISLVFD